VVILSGLSIPLKLFGHRPGLPGKVITFHIVPLDPACKARLAGHVPGKEQLVKGIADFEDGEMFEVFFHAFNGEDLFDKGFSAHGMSPVGNLSFIAISRIDLANPPRISVTRHPDKNVRVKIAEPKPIQTQSVMHRHDLLWVRFAV
jgi:hypothetical protein